MSTDPSEPPPAPANNDEGDPPAPPPAQSPPSAARWHSASWWSGAAGIAAILSVAIALLAWLLPRSPDDPAGSPKTSQPSTSAGSSVVPSTAIDGKILFPRDIHGEGRTDHIPQRITISGVAHISGGHRLWLLVGFPNGGNWFPANGNPEQGAQDDYSITVGPDGAWRQDVEFGNDSQKGQVFDLALVDVGPQGAAQLSEYFKKQDQSGEYVGIPRGKLAADIRPLHAIAVQREP